jgi:hypothetical protein
MTNRLAAGLVAGALALGLLAGAAGTILATGGPAWPDGSRTMMGSGGWRGYGPMMGGGWGHDGPMMDPDDMGPYASLMPDWMWQHMGWSAVDEPSGQETPR